MFIDDVHTDMAAAPGSVGAVGAGERSLPGVGHVVQAEVFLVGRLAAAHRALEDEGGVARAHPHVGQLVERNYSRRQAVLLRIRIPDCCIIGDPGVHRLRSSQIRVVGNKHLRHKRHTLLLVKIADKYIPATTSQRKQ